MDQASGTYNPIFQSPKAPIPPYPETTDSAIQQIIIHVNSFGEDIKS